MLFLFFDENDDSDDDIINGAERASLAAALLADPAEPQTRSVRAPPPRRVLCAITGSEVLIATLRLGTQDLGHRTTAIPELGSKARTESPPPGPEAAAPRSPAAAARAARSGGRRAASEAGSRSWSEDDEPLPAEKSLPSLKAKEATR